MATSLRILIVEDYEDTAEMLATAFRFCGHEVAVAHSGLEALPLFDSFSPQVAILDIGLPLPRWARTRYSIAG